MPTRHGLTAPVPVAPHRLSRRGFLRTGALGPGGLTLPGLLRAEAADGQHVAGLAGVTAQAVSVDRAQASMCLRGPTLSRIYPAPAQRVGQRRRVSRHRPQARASARVSDP